MILFVVKIVFQIALWIWFLGCTTTYKFGNYTLVEGMGIKSAEFVTQCLYSIALITYYFVRPVGKWILFFVLILWLVVQFFCHWYYTLFGASEQKLKGYNECFKNTVHVFPMSDTRLIPDLYHIVQHTLMLVNVVLCLV